MDAPLLLELLKAPEKVKMLSFEELEQLVVNYPYCQNIRLLLLSKYFQGQHLSKDRYYQLAALYAIDIQHMHAFLQSCLPKKDL